MHWPHAGPGISLPHKNHSPVFNFNNCYPYATGIMISLSRDRKVIRVKHARQFILDKKNHLTGGGGQRCILHIVIIGRIPCYI